MSSDRPNLLALGKCSDTKMWTVRKADEKQKKNLKKQKEEEDGQKKKQNLREREADRKRLVGEMIEFVKKGMVGKIVEIGGDVLDLSGDEGADSPMEMRFVVSLAPGWALRNFGRI